MNGKMIVPLIVIAIVAAAGAIVAISREGTRGQPPQLDLMDMSRFRQVDQSLLLYEETTRIPSGFTTARGIAIDSLDNLYVVGDTSLHIFDKARRLVRSISADAEPLCVAVDETGIIYVGFTDRVTSFSPEGTTISAWPSFGERAFVTSVVAYEDSIFVADAGNRRVTRHSPDGTIIATITDATRTDAEGKFTGLVVPSANLDIAMAADGLLRVVNPGRHLIEAHTIDGQRELAWGKSSFAIDGFSGCCNPTAIAILSNGDIVTSEKGLPRIKVLRDLTGELAAVVAAPDAFNDRTSGIDLAVDSQDRIYALDTFNSTVRIYERK